MATASMVPYSNRVGNNQTTPGAGAGGTSSLIKTPQVEGTVPTNPTATPMETAQNNPYVPSPIPMGTSDGSTPNTAAAGGFITNNSSYANGENDLQKQYIDIYGKGVGGSLFSLLNDMSGTNSAVLQEYIQSLMPQEAKAQADLNASLGAGGVSANSSVAALGDANLQAQEFAAISGESANLTQNQENLTAQILSGTQGAASKEVASSGWDVFGQVMQGLGGVAGSVISAAGDAGGFSNLFH